MERFKCLLCGDESAPDLVKNGTRDSDQDVVRCKKCNHVQLFPLSTAEEEADYYDTNAHDKVNSPGMDNDAIFQKFLFQNENRRRYLIEEAGIQKEWTCLDYASGYGHFIELMAGGVLL